jgi:pilus assembly protein FimV
MVRQELQQTKENLAARDAEVQELKARVAELEQLQQKQSQLLAMKDNALASAQQKLAAGQQAVAAPAPKPDNGSLLPWIGAAVGLVLLAVVAVLWLRRRAAEPAVVTALRNDVARDQAPPADAFDTETFDTTAFDSEAFDAEAADTAADEAPVPADEPPAAPPPSPDEAPATEASPAWSRLAPSADPEPPKPAVPARPVPTWHSGGVEVSPLNPATPGQGRLDLAKAYLDMGDRDTARSLLQEVAARGDTLGVRMEADRLLRDLG